MRSRNQQVVSSLFERRSSGTRPSETSELERISRRMVKKCLTKCNRLCDAECTIPDMKR
ncbi:MAG: hypothetical protein U0787_18880 [Polyangia bacterium]